MESIKPLWRNDLILENNQHLEDEPYFYSIEKQRTATLKIKRSIFICTLAYVDSIETAKQFITRISRENKTATHNCWAYILGEKGAVFHCSDAGEPSGTAGKPMLNMLQRRDMTSIAAVVTRHFGGVKLGVRGLIDAYGAAVSHALDLGPLKRLVHSMDIEIESSYEFNDILMNQIKTHLFRVRNTTYSDKIVHQIQIELKKYPQVKKLLYEYQAQGKLKFRILP